MYSQRETHRHFWAIHIDMYVQFTMEAKGFQSNSIDAAGLYEQWGHFLKTSKKMSAGSSDLGVPGFVIGGDILVHCDRFVAHYSGGLKRWLQYRFFSVRVV